MAILTTEKHDRKPNASHKGDFALAQAGARGDEKARRVVAARLYERIRTAVHYLSGDHRDKDDWVQMALVEILRSLGSFRGESALESWANRITVRVAMRQMKRESGREKVVALHPDPRSNGTQDPTEEHRRIEMRRCLARILGTLSDERRMAITLRLVYEYSVAEIAEMTGAPHDTVRNRLRRGRRQLRKKVALDPVFSDWVRSRKL